MTTDLTKLKRSTEIFIKASRKRRHKKEEVVDDYLDYSIINLIEKINLNPDIATTGSCSGHSGYPFISLVFKNATVRDIYLKKFKKAGYTIGKSDDLRMTFFDSWYPKLVIHEEWDVQYKIKVSKKSVKKFWDDCVKILTVD